MSSFQELVIPFNKKNSEFFPIQNQQRKELSFVKTDLPIDALKELLEHSDAEKIPEKNRRAIFVDSFIDYLRHPFIKEKDLKLAIFNIVGASELKKHLTAKESENVLEQLRDFLIKNPEFDYFDLGVIPLYFNSSIILWGKLNYSFQGAYFDLTLSPIISSLRYNLSNVFSDANAFEKDGTLNYFSAYDAMDDTDFLNQQVMDYLFDVQTSPLFIFNSRCQGVLSSESLHTLDRKSNYYRDSFADIFRSLKQKELLSFTFRI